MRRQNNNSAMTALGLLTAACIVYFSFAGFANGGTEKPTLQDGETITINGIVRDFQAADEPGGHPDFGARPAGGFDHVIGNVAGRLDLEGKPVFTGAGRKCLQQWKDSDNNNLHPQWYDTSLDGDEGEFGSFDTSGILDEISFSQWFRDVPTVNMSAPLSITLVADTEKQGWVFDDRYSDRFEDLDGFFPINGELFAKGAGSVNNYNFTYEAEVSFIHEQGNGHTFTFRADDDLWVFIDGRLVADIGGVHDDIEQTVHLDRLGLEDGREYSLKFFFAERHRTASTLCIETTLFLLSGDVPIAVALYE